MTEAMPFLQKYDITFLRPPTIPWGPSIAAAAILTLLFGDAVTSAYLSLF